MKVKRDSEGHYDIRDSVGFSLLSYPMFESITALENHIKLMLIAVQQYKEKKVD